jgi:uncharacterized delta-60 repeat protein
MSHFISSARVSVAVAVLSVVGSASALDPAPIAWWRGEGNALDSAGRFHGELVGSAGTGAGQVGAGFTNLGRGNYVSIPMSYELRPEARSFTTENWVRVHAAGGEWLPLTLAQIGSFGLVYNRVGKFLRSHASTNKVYVVGQYVDVAYELPMDEWVHVAQSYDASTGVQRIYVNGQELVAQVGIDFGWGWIYDRGPTLLGHIWATFDPGIDYTASFDEVSFYDRALTGEELHGIFEAGAAGKAVAPVIANGGLAKARAGEAYSYALRAGAGVAPYSFSLAGGALPSGLTLSAAGVLSGIASAADTSSVTIQVADEAGRASTKTFAITVEACGAPSGLDGKVDRSFGTEGHVRAPRTDWEQDLGPLARQSTGKLLSLNVGNGLWYYIPRMWFIQRFHADGEIDASFNGGQPLGVQDSSPAAMIVDAQDRILVSGTGNAWPHRHEVRRFLPDGAVDTSFGTGGIASVEVGGYNNSAGELLLQPDGKILLAGSLQRTVNGSQQGNFLAVRFDTNGSLDPSFGNGGIAEIDTGEGEVSWALALQPDGKILLGGNGWAGHLYGDLGWATLIARLSPTGQLDPSFGTNGFVFTPFQRYDGTIAIRVQPDGKILQAARLDTSYNDFSIGLARYHPDGTPDRCFGTNGKVYARYPHPTQSQLSMSTMPSSFELLPDGNMVAGASIVIPDFGPYNFYGTLNDVGMARFDPRGRLDTSFGENGWMRAGLFRTAWQGAALLREPDGDFILGGAEWFAGRTMLSLVRVHGSGNCPFSTNKVPVAVDDEYTLIEGPADFDVLANDHDPEGDAPRLVSVIPGPGTHGTVEALGSGKVRYTPERFYRGVATFQYTIGDCEGAIGTGTVRVTVNPPECTPEPAGRIASWGTKNGSPNESLQDIATTLHGSAVVGDARVGDGYIGINGKDSYAASTGNAPFSLRGGSSTVTSWVRLDVANNNGWVPLSAIVDGEFGLWYHAGWKILRAHVWTSASNAGALLFADAQYTMPLGEWVHFAQLWDASTGQVAVYANGTALPIPTASSGYSNPGPSPVMIGKGWQHDQSFTDYAGAWDELDVYARALSPAEIAAIHGARYAGFCAAVPPPPDNVAPVAGDDAASTNEDTPVTPDVLGNDCGVNGDLLTVVAVTNGQHGTVVIDTAGTVTYTPAADWNGTDRFTYTISDGQTTATATVTVVVAPVNDAPTAVADVVDTAEDTAVTVNVLANDVDADGDALAVASVTQGSFGSVEINADGTLTYTPQEDAHGTDAFTYTATDGLLTSTATVTVNVLPENDAPLAQSAAHSLAEDTSLAILLAAHDVESASLSYSIVNAPLHGTLALAGNIATYTPHADYHGPDSFSFQASDGAGGSNVATISLVVTPVNDAPVLAPVGDRTVTAGTPMYITLSASDIDDTALVFCSSALPAGATLNPTSGFFTWTPTAAQVGSYDVTFCVRDPSGATSTQPSQLTVLTPTPANRVPICSAAAPSDPEIWPPNHRQVQTIGITGVYDPDRDPVRITVTRILQDEPTDTWGDGSFCIDAFGVGTSQAQVRAERSGTAKVPGDGRIYEIFFRAEDNKGGVCTGSVKVGVPHDQGSGSGGHGGHGTAVDSGVRYDSTVCRGPRVN